MAQAKIQFDTTNYLNSATFAGRIQAWNTRAHKASMAATMRWADRLSTSQYGGPKKRLPIAHWWAGDPYGKRPPTVATWARKVAKANSPQVFRYTPPDDMELAKAVYQRGKYCAKTVDDVPSELLKLGVKPEQLA